MMQQRRLLSSPCASQVQQCGVQRLLVPWRAPASRRPPACTSDASARPAAAAASACRGCGATRFHQLGVQRRSRSSVVARAAATAPRLHIPDRGSSGDPVVDIIVGAAMQAQQFTRCYNNCLATSVAMVGAAEVLGVPGYRLVFGHLASAKDGVAGQVPHVWVEQERLGLILDATLSDVVPTGEMFKLKEQLRYVPGRASQPLPNAGLPVEAPTEERLEFFASNPEQYLAEIKDSPSGPKALAYLLYLSLTQGLAGAKDDIQQLIQQ